MKKLGAKIIGIVIIVFMMNHLFYRFFVQPNVDYTWGYDIIHAKRDFLKSNNDQINTLFIGSSAMFRHIDPRVFDANINDSLGIHSFNFGIQAMFPLQSAYIYEHLLEKDSIQLKYAFMDLFEIGNMALAPNAVKKRTHYWYRWSDYKEALKISSAYDSPLYVKWNAYFGYTIAYIAKLFNAEIIEEILLKQKSRAQNDFPFLQNDINGYYPLDQEYLDKKDESKEMEMRRNAFLKDTSMVTNAIISRRDFFRKYDADDYKINPLHLQKINELIALSEDKGIHLIFILHPRLFAYEYPLVMPLYDAIDDAHKLNLNDADKYHSFYEAKYTFDALHLNEAGATIYSKALAEEFNQLLKNKP
ncbi:MAG: hypothetical protein R2730_11555 [Chitinophagales bacterium]